MSTHPCKVLQKAWMQGLESVRIYVVFLFFDYIWAQCCTGNEIANVSTSHGSHFMWWGLNLAEKKPPRSVLFCYMVCSTAPIPLVTALSFVMINLFSGRGADCALEKDCRRSSDQQICALDSWSAVTTSRSWSRISWFERYGFKCLKAPIQPRIPRAMLGG